VDEMSVVLGELLAMCGLEKAEHHGSERAT